MKRLTKFMRALHLYTGLFLVPWFLVYATSGLLINHGPLITKWLGRPQVQMEVVREESFVAPDDFPHEQPAQAKELLQFLELDGMHRLDRRSNAQRLIIFRLSGGGNYRISWTRANGALVVERQRPFRLRFLLNFLHFRHGYGQPYFANIAWAVMVDCVTISMWLWVISGIYLWAKMPRKRWAGVACLGGGLLLFIGLALLMCR